MDTSEIAKNPKMTSSTESSSIGSSESASSYSANAPKGLVSTVNAEVPIIPVPLHNEHEISENKISYAEQNSEHEESIAPMASEGGSSVVEESRNAKSPETMEVGQNTLPHVGYCEERKARMEVSSGGHPLDSAGKQGNECNTSKEVLVEMRQEGEIGEENVIDSRSICSTAEGKSENTCLGERLDNDTTAELVAMVTTARNRVTGDFIGEEEQAKCGSSEIIAMQSEGDNSIEKDGVDVLHLTEKTAPEIPSNEKSNCVENCKVISIAPSEQVVGVTETRHSEVVDLEVGKYENIEMANTWEDKVRESERDIEEGTDQAMVVESTLAEHPDQGKANDISQPPTISGGGVNDISENGTDPNNPIVIDSGDSEPEDSDQDSRKGQKEMDEDERKGESTSNGNDQSQAAEEDLDEDDALETLENELAESCGSYAGTYLGHSNFELYPAPGLEVESLGLIRIPVDPADAVKLMQHGYQAPYGKGEETIVDTNFRKTHQIDAKNISFRNPAFEKWLRNTVLPTLLQTLGVDDSNVRMELYKLLVYETGGHFKQHRDSVKTPGMFATLAVTLPSLYEGGQLVFQHNKDKTVLDFSKNSEFILAAAAWYSDVVHSVEPITAGYRLVLTYNIASSNLSHNYSANTTGISPVLKRAMNSLDKVAYLLDFQYSQVEFNQLKGSDKYIVDHLRHAADQLGYNLYLANVDISRSGYDEVDDNEFETYINLKRFVLVTGNFGSFEDASISWDEDRFLPLRWSEDRSPDSEKEEYTGNEGVTVDRMYYGVCAVVWPSECTFTILQKYINPKQIFQQTIDEATNNSVNLAESRATAHALIKIEGLAWKDKLKLANLLDDKSLVTETIATSKAHELTKENLSNLLSQSNEVLKFVEQGFLKWAKNQAFLTLLQTVLGLQPELPKLTDLFLRCVKANLEKSRGNPRFFSPSTYSSNENNVEDLTITEAVKLLKMLGPQHAGMFIEPFMNNSMHYQRYVRKALQTFQRQFPQEEHRWATYQIHAINNWTKNFQLMQPGSIHHSVPRIWMEILPELKAFLEYILLHGATWDIRQKFLTDVFSMKIMPLVSSLKNSIWNQFQPFFEGIITCFREALERQPENKQDKTIVGVFNNLLAAVLNTGQQVIAQNLRPTHGLAMIIVSYILPAATHCLNAKCLASTPQPLRRQPITTSLGSYPLCSGVRKLNQFLTSQSTSTIIAYSTKSEYDCIRLTAKEIPKLTCQKVVRLDRVALRKHNMEPAYVPQRPGELYRVVTVAQHNDAVQKWHNFCGKVGDKMPEPIINNLSEEGAVTPSLDGLSGQKRKATEASQEGETKRVKGDPVDGSCNDSTSTATSADQFTIPPNLTTNKPLAVIVLDDD